MVTRVTARVFTTGELPTSTASPLQEIPVSSTVSQPKDSTTDQRAIGGTPHHPDPHNTGNLNPLYSKEKSLPEEELSTCIAELTAFSFSSQSSQEDMVKLARLILKIIPLNSIISAQLCSNVPIFHTKLLEKKVGKLLENQALCKRKLQEIEGTLANVFVNKNLMSSLFAYPSFQRGLDTWSATLAKGSAREALQEAKKLPDLVHRIEQMFTQGSPETLKQVARKIISLIESFNFVDFRARNALECSCSHAVLSYELSTLDAILGPAVIDLSATESVDLVKQCVTLALTFLSTFSEVSQASRPLIAPSQPTDQSKLNRTLYSNKVSESIEKLFSLMKSKLQQLNLSLDSNEFKSSDSEQPNLQILKMLTMRLLKESFQYNIIISDFCETAQIYSQQNPYITLSCICAILRCIQGKLALVNIPETADSSSAAETSALTAALPNNSEELLESLETLALELHSKSSVQPLESTPSGTSPVDHCDEILNGLIERYLGNEPVADNDTADETDEELRVFKVVLQTHLIDPQRDSMTPENTKQVENLFEHIRTSRGLPTLFELYFSILQISHPDQVDEKVVQFLISYLVSLQALIATRKSSGQIQLTDKKGTPQFFMQAEADLIGNLLEFHSRKESILCDFYENTLFKEFEPGKINRDLLENINRFLFVLEQQPQ